MTSVLSWNSFQSKLAEGCPIGSYTKEDMSSLYLLYKDGKISRGDLKNCDKLDTLIGKLRLTVTSKDVMHQILIKLEVEDVLKVCGANKKMREVYCGDDFWKLYVKHNVDDYLEKNKSIGIAEWKEIALRSAIPMDLYTLSKRKDLRIDIESVKDKFKEVFKGKDSDLSEISMGIVDGYLDDINNKIKDIYPKGIDSTKKKYTFVGVPIGKVIDMMDDRVSRITIKGLGRVKNIRENEDYEFGRYIDYFPEMDYFVFGYNSGAYLNDKEAYLPMEGSWVYFILRFNGQNARLYRKEAVVGDTYIAINIDNNTVSYLDGIPDYYCSTGYSNIIRK